MESVNFSVNSHDRTLCSTKWLEDGKSLVQQDVKSDQIVYLVFRLEGDHVDDAFEEIDIVSDEHLELEEEEH